MQPPSIEFPVLPDPPGLTPVEEKALSALAAEAVEAECLRAEHPGHPTPSTLPGLQAVVGVFVTIFHREGLRGCLGMVEGHEPLYQAVPRLARAAASRDYRFAPVGADELPELSVEITLLGSLVRLPSDPGVLLAGLDPTVLGVYLCARGRTGLLLPQVARRYGWDAGTLLDQVSVKAGLDAGAWRDPGAQVFGFRARSIEAVRPGELPRRGHHPVPGR